MSLPYVPCNPNVLLNTENRNASVEHVTNNEWERAVYIRRMSTGLEHLLLGSRTASFIKDKHKIKISHIGGQAN